MHKIPCTHCRWCKETKLEDLREVKYPDPNAPDPVRPAPPAMITEYVCPECAQDAGKYGWSRFGKYNNMDPFDPHYGPNPTAAQKEAIKEFAASQQRLRGSRSAPLSISRISGRVF